MKKSILSLGTIMFASTLLISCKNDTANSNTESTKDSVSNATKVVEQPKVDTVKKEIVDKKLMTPEKIELSGPPNASYSIDGKDVAADEGEGLYMHFMGKKVNFKLNKELSKKNNRIYESGVYKIKVIISSSKKGDEGDDVSGNLVVSYNKSDSITYSIKGYESSTIKNLVK